MSGLSGQRFGAVVGAARGANIPYTALLTAPDRSARRLFDDLTDQVTRGRFEEPLHALAACRAASAALTGPAAQLLCGVVREANFDAHVVYATPGERTCRILFGDQVGWHVATSHDTFHGSFCELERRLSDRLAAGALTSAALRDLARDVYRENMCAALEGYCERYPVPVIAALCENREPPECVPAGVFSGPVRALVPALAGRGQVPVADATGLVDAGVRDAQRGLTAALFGAAG